MERRLAAILAADVAGYSTQMEAAEEQPAEELAQCQLLIAQTADRDRRDGVRRNRVEPQGAARPGASAATSHLTPRNSPAPGLAAGSRVIRGRNASKSA